MPARHAQAVSVEGIHVDEGKGFRVCGTLILFLFVIFKSALYRKLFFLLLRSFVSASHADQWKREGRGLTGQIDVTKGDARTCRQRLSVVDVMLLYSTY